MMVLYSGTNCPFSQRCRLVLFEKGMDFEIRDVDLFNKPEDISVMNPYGQVPILVERDLILYESNIINEYIDERFANWEDEGDMMVGFILDYLQKPGSIDFLDLVGDEKMKFATELLDTAIDKKGYTEEVIKPKLNNWDPERIAVIDMILLRLGVCELLYFDTIPTKVTINEYIDLAKDYSTEQSGHFVNGILDNIHKELVGSGKIQKISHKNK